MAHRTSGRGGNSGNNSSGKSNFTPAPGQSYFTPSGGGAPQPASAGGAVSQGFVGRGSGSQGSSGSGGGSTPPAAAPVTQTAPSATQSTDTSASSTTPWVQVSVSAFGTPIYERKVGGTTERVSQGSVPTSETKGIPQPITYTPAGVELKYITKEGKFVYGAVAERTIIPAGDRPNFQANILTSIKNGVVVDPFEKQSRGGSQEKEVYRGGVEHKYTTQEGEFVYGAVTQQTTVPVGARPNFQANILAAVSTGYEGKQQGVTVSPYPVRIKEDIAEPSGVIGAYERSNRYLSGGFKDFGLFETDYLDRELVRYTLIGAESRRRQETGEGLQLIEKYTQFSAEQSGPFILGIEKGVRTRVRERPLSVASDFALIAGGGYAVSASRFGLVKLAGRFPALKGGVTKIREAGGLAGKGLVGIYGGTVAYNIASTPGGAFEKGQTTGSEVVTAGAFVAGGKFATRVTRPINYQTEFEEGLQSLPVARQAKVRAEISELKPQLETIKSGAVKPTELEFSQVERLNKMSAPVVKKFVLDYKDQLVVGGSLGQRTQIPVSGRSKLSKPSDVDIYSDNPVLSRILAADLKASGVPAFRRGQKIYIEGAGKAVEFHALTDTAIGRGGLKTSLESTLGTVRNPLLPYSFSFTKTPEGVRVTNIPLQAQRKLYGGFEVSKDAKGKAYMYRYSKDIPNYRQLVSATLRRSNSVSRNQNDRTFSLLLRGKKAQVGLLPERAKTEKQSTYRLSQKVKSPTNEKYQEYKKVSTYAPYKTIPRYGGYTSPSPYKGHPLLKESPYPASKKIISPPYSKPKGTLYPPLPKVDGPYKPSPERPYTPPSTKLRQFPYPGTPRPPRTPPYNKPEGLLTPPPSKIKIPKFGIELPEYKIKIPSEKRKRGFKWTPSLVASEFNIQAPKGAATTGLEIRGLPKGFERQRYF